MHWSIQIACWNNLPKALQLEQNRTKTEFMNKDQLKKLEADLSSAADKLRANSDLKSSE